MAELTQGKPLPIKFLESEADFAQNLIGSAYANGATSLSEIGAAGIAAGKLTKEEKAQTAPLRVPSLARDILVSDTDFIGDSNRLATGLHVLKQMGHDLPAHALEYVALHSPIDRLAKPDTSLSLAKRVIAAGASPSGTGG